MLHSENVENIGRVAVAVGVPAGTPPPPPLVVVECHPSSIRGGQVAKSGLLLSVDWVAGSFPAAMLSPVVAHLEEIFGAGERRDRGSMSYARSIAFECGAFINFSPGRDDACVVLPGKACQALTVSAMRDLMGWLVAHGLKGTRVDIAADDPERAYFDFDSIGAAWRRGEVPRFKTFDDRTVESRSGLSGRSLTFGRRGKLGGGKSVQFYDKELESGGEIPGIRMEVRFFKKHADAVLFCLARSSSLDWYERVLRECAGGAVDFVEVGSAADRHLDRRARLPWWQRVVDALGAARVSVQRVKSRLQGAAQQMFKQYGLTVGLIVREVEKCGYDAWALLRDAFEPFVVAAKHSRPAATLDPLQLIGLADVVPT